MCALPWNLPFAPQSRGPDHGLIPLEETSFRNGIARQSSIALLILQTLLRSRKKTYQMIDKSLNTM